MLQIHKASAGSGKTYSLTKSYLRMLLAEKRKECGGAYRLRPLSSYGFGKPKAHGSILAVTFTNKATEEMTSRIINELALLARPRRRVDGSMKRSPYADDFIREFSTDESTLSLHARQALSDLLHNFSWFNVSTIDSFFQRVLNTFARELELTPTHTIELDDNYVLGIATGKLLASINADPRSSSAASTEDTSRRRRVEKWLKLFMGNQLADGNQFSLLSQSSSVNSSLVEYMGKLFNEEYKLHRSEIDTYLADRSKIDSFQSLISGNSTLAAMQEPLARRCAAMAAKGDGIINWRIRNALNEVAAGNFDKKPAPTCFIAITDPSKRPNSAKVSIPQAMEEELVELLKDLDCYWQNKELFKQMQFYTFLLALFGEISHYLEEYRREHDSILLSDTNDLLNRIINEEETPFIYERMGTAIHHYLIDEFQDTSRMQWENLRPLLLESLGNENDNLIIGDEKQCIYRFRNSDPHLLGSDVENMVSSRFSDSVDIRGIDVSENCNWRSSAAVVQFNNSVFRRLARLLDSGLSGSPISHTYAGLIQDISPRHLPAKNPEAPASDGYIRIEFLPTVAEGGAAKETATPADEGNEQDSAAMEELQFRRMVSQIDRQLSAGYQPRQIAILVRKVREGKNIIARLMKWMESEQSWRHGQVPIVSSDSMSVSLSPAVRMIVNVLRLATQPLKVKNPDSAEPDNTKINMAYRRYRLLHRFELCRFDLVPETDDAGAPLLDAGGKPLMRRLTTKEAFEKAVAATEPPIGESPDPVQQTIDRELIRLADMESPTLPAMTDHIISRFLTPDSRVKEVAFITAFQDLVLDFSEFGNNNIMEFLKWWDQKGQYTNVSAPEGIDAISVMTIHKAKGLEFECVHFPFCSGPMVKQHSENLKSISWYRLSPELLPMLPPEVIPPYIPLPNKLSNKSKGVLRLQAEQWETEQKIDALNLAYVAFTRAVSELIVYCDRSAILSASDEKMAPAQAGPSDSWLLSDYLLMALSSASESLIHTPGGSGEKADVARALIVPLSSCMRTLPDGEMIFEYGAPTAPSSDRTPEIPLVEEPRNFDVPADLPLLPYADMLGEYRVFEHSDIAASMDFEDLVDFDFNNDRHHGIFLHAVLSKVRHRSDLPKALHAMAYRYHLTPVQIQECRTVLSEALADERVTPWFEGYRRVLNERALTGIYDTRRRPDRVVWLPDGKVVVIDYKFGEHNPPSYRNQVRDYVNHLAFAGYPDAEGYLWFPIKGEIIKVV